MGWRTIENTPVVITCGSSLVSLNTIFRPVQANNPDMTNTIRAIGTRI